MLLFLMNMGSIQSDYLKRYLRSFSRMHQIFYRDEFQLVERRWKLVDGHYSLHDFLTYFELDDLIGDYDVTT
jgi:hypothetical protein